MNDTKTSLDAALQAINSGEFAEAERLSRMVIALEPENAKAWHLCGIACGEQDSLENAAECFENSVKFKPSVASYHYNLGLAYRKLKRLDEAASCYRTAIEKKPEFIEAVNNLGALLVEQGATQEAKETYCQILEKNPDSNIAHYNYGCLLEELGQPDDAIEHYRLAVELDASFSSAQHALVEALIQQERGDEAEEVFREWLKLNPRDEFANHMKSLISGEAPPDRCADEYVRATFDKQFADSYESQLSKIGYQGPAMVQDALNCLDRELVDLDVLDAGCGTGLCSSILRPFARKLVGVDLSPDMLAQARLKNQYDELIESELTSFLQSLSSAYDLIAAADTLIYFGNLREVIGAARGALKIDGVFVFTVECLANDDLTSTFELQVNGRYSHLESYVRQVVNDEGFELARCIHAVLRREQGRPVDGIVVTAIRRT